MSSNQTCKCGHHKRVHRGEYACKQCTCKKFRKMGS